MLDDWITTAEAAELADYEADTIRRLVRAGVITARKFGPVWQISKRDLLDYVRRMAERGKKRGRKPG
jgi:excisionase family DNA binding protein